MASPKLTQEKQVEDDDLAGVAPETPPEAAEGSGHPNPRDITGLAHQHWEERGRPLGTPEEDWFRAENEIKLRGRPVQDNSEEGDAGPSE